MDTSTANPSRLTEACRRAIVRMQSGSVPIARVPSDARHVLEDRGIACELSAAGYLELTPRGRGVDPATFEA